MQLKTIRHLWGVEEPPSTFFTKVRAENYHGVESALPASGTETAFRGLLDENGLEYIAQIFTDGPTFVEHIESFRRQARAAVEMKAVMVNCHGGKDGWSLADSLHFYRAAIEIERDLGIPVAHETHRGRILFNPWITRDILNEIPDLALCCDFSHWVCVAERLLPDCGEIIAQCAERCLHLHARVGYEQGPQVPDPRAPEYQVHVETHEKWWDIIWSAQEKSGMTYSYLTPEFGPPTYLPTLPFSNKPVASLEEICLWQVERQRQRFHNRVAK